MYFVAKIVAAAGFAASLVNATNTITFINRADITKEVIFTPSYGFAPIDTLKVDGNDEAKVEIPPHWEGNWFSIDQGSPIIPGMLGEVTFQGWNGLTYFDVSAIVNASDHTGVQTIYPASLLKAKVKTSMSGCANSFPCNTAYYHPDDIQTVSTTETNLICTLGAPSTDIEKRDESTLVPRKYVLGKL